MPNLFNETGHASQDDRNTEAFRYIDELSVVVEQMESHEAKFIRDMADKKDRNELRCSGKQLFWLRDLYSKYILEE